MPDRPSSATDHGARERSTGVLLLALGVLTLLVIPAIWSLVQERGLRAAVRASEEATPEAPVGVGVA